MIKYSKFIIFSFLIFSFSDSQPQEEFVLPIRIMKDLIIKYQNNEETKYLAKLLRLPRHTLKSKFIKSLQKYKELIISNEDSRYLEDFEETQSKIENIKIVLAASNKWFGEQSESSIVLQKSLNIQNKLINNYEKFMKEEENIRTIDKNNALTKMFFLLEALYLTTTTATDLTENKKWYKLLSKRFHPDKTRDFDEETKEQAADFFKSFQPILNDHKNNNHLKGIIEAIRQKRNEVVEISLAHKISRKVMEFSNATVLPFVSEGIGVGIGNKICAKLSFITDGENLCRDVCVANARQSALQIEKQLIKHYRS